MLCAALVMVLIFYRQHLRHENYEVSWDVSFSNVLASEEVSSAVQLGLCVINPNYFPVTVSVPVISANVGKRSGSYALHETNRRMVIGPYSTNLAVFSDPIPLDLASMPLTSDDDRPVLEGTMQATIAYTRDEGGQPKELPIRLDFGLIINERNLVQALSIDPTSGSIPYNYAVNHKAISACRKL